MGSQASEGSNQRIVIGNRGDRATWLQLNHKAEQPGSKRGTQGNEGLADRSAGKIAGNVQPPESTEVDVDVACRVDQVRNEKGLHFWWKKALMLAVFRHCVAGKSKISLR